jgi:hypothetical protein
MGQGKSVLERGGCHTKRIPRKQLGIPRKQYLIRGNVCGDSKQLVLRSKQLVLGIQHIATSTWKNYSQDSGSCPAVLETNPHSILFYAPSIK